MPEFVIKKDLCVSCGLCADACMFSAMTMEEGPVYREENCTFCGACKEVCPSGAISFGEEDKKTESTIPKKESPGGIWVFAQQWDGVIHTAARELLSKGRELSDQSGQKLSAVVLGYQIREAAEELLLYGADEVFYLEQEDYRYPDEELCAQVLVQMIHRYRPEVILYAATTFGRGFAPMVAARMQTGLTADCTELAMDPESGLLLQTRPAFGGNVMATIVCKDRRPQMATVRPGVFAKKEVRMPQGRVTNLDGKEFPVSRKTEILKIEPAEKTAVSLEAADRIVAGGAGFASADEYAIVEEVAELLKGASAASRSAVDAGYAPSARQVGQTGVTVSPKLYIAAGISGAIQHIVGMQGSECVVAINTDPNAPIFQVADIGIIGDAKEILNELKRRLEEK